MKPLDPGLNQAVLALAPKAFRVADTTPALQSIEEFAKFWVPGGRLVWGGASYHSIYADAAVNWAFRAWHDECHVAVKAEFDLPGETRAYMEQVRQLYERFPSAPKRWARILRAEVIDQAAHFLKTGRFPEDQVAFVRNVI